MTTQRQVSVRKYENGWFVILEGIGSDGTLIEAACVDPKRREPFVQKEDALVAARFVASHFKNDDGSDIEIIDEDGE
jgi:hypothetical protein